MDVCTCVKVASSVVGHQSTLFTGKSEVDINNSSDKYDIFEFPHDEGYRDKLEGIVYIIFQELKTRKIEIQLTKVARFDDNIYYVDHWCCYCCEFAFLVQLVLAVGPCTFFL